MNTRKGTTTYKQAFLIFVLAIWALLWQPSAFAANDPDVTGDGRVNALDVSTVASCIGRDLVSVARCRCADTNSDNIIDKVDYGFVAAKVGTSGYPLEPNACQAIKPNTPPSANAGPDQTVTTGRTVALSASGSSDVDGDTLTFSWTFTSIPAGSTATLSNPTTVTPGFVIDRPGNYIVQVSVSDGKASSTDTVAISTINSPPVANAGSNQGIFIGDTVTLNGSASSDADGDTLSFRWSFTASIPVGSTATLTGATSVNPTFIADRAGSYQVQLIVNDGTADSAPSTVTISTRNTPPVANAGVDQGVTLGSTVQLNGVASSDIDGDQLTFAWSLTRPTGSAATLSAASAVNPTFTADVSGAYVAQLIVNDGSVNSVADTVMISVTPVNVAPTANAGADQSAALGAMVQLNGAASNDPEGTPLTYRWSFTSRPVGSAAILSAINIVNPVFVVDRVGSYIAQLIVNDGVLSSPPDTMIVTTFNPVPVANAGPDQTVTLSTPAATVTLDGRASSDANGDTLVYSWSFTSVPPGSTATLTNSGASRPTFTPSHAGNYVVQLIVSDGTTNSPPDTVMITVTPAPNRAPIANAGVDRTGSIGTAVSLSGAASSDPDVGDTLTYQWSFASRPAGSAAALTNPTAVNAAFTPDVAGTYDVQLIVNDGSISSPPDTVRVTVASSLPAITISAPDASASEAGLDPGTFTFIRSGGGALNQPLQVFFTISGSATFAGASDYAATSGGNLIGGSSVVTIPANQTSITATITPTADNRVENNETVVFTLNANAAYSIGVPSSATVTIADSSAIVSIIATDAAASEVGLDPGMFTFTRSGGGALNQPLQVFFTISGSATSTASTDYVATSGGSVVGSSGFVTIPANQTSITATITPTADNLVESSETVVFTLNANAAYSIGVSSSATVTIADSALPNTAPLAVVDNYQTNEGQTLQIVAPGVLVNDSDDQGDPLTAELVSTTAQGTLTLQADGSFIYVPSLGFAGIDQFSYRARDASLSSMPVTVEIVVTPDSTLLPLDMDLTVTPQTVPVGGSVTITVTPRGGSIPVSRALSVDGTPIPLDATGNATITAVSQGIHRVVATVTDTLGAVSKEAFFSGQVTGDTTAPTADITSPTNSTELFGSIDIQGTANDLNLAEYRLLFASSGSTQFTEFARGVNPVVNGTLGRFDVTSLTNGLYDILLQATDVNGATSQALVTVEVVGDQKVGNFQISFEDLNVDAAGIPIVVTRTYDTTRRAESLDFGHGWSVDYQNVKVQTNKILGQDWVLSSTGFIIRNWCVKPNGKHTVSVTLPDGKVERFDMIVSPECQQIIPALNVTPVFTARPGSRSKLTTSSGVLFVNGSQLLDLDTGGPFDPDSFTLTTEDNFVYQLDKNFGIRSVRDPSGNTLTYSSNGIIHSGGQSVSFQRDARGRITRITDPNGKTLDYTYNTNGDLATVTDRAGKTARHRYNRSHGLVDFTDPRGVLLMRNVYDANGKLIEQYDAAGNKVAITSDTANQREVVRDRRGFTTTHEYDVTGNVTRTIDALGGATGYSYDARGNELSTTDPLGRITARSFSTEDRLLSETDPLGNVTAYTYDPSGQPTQIADAKGNKTEITYSPVGNPSQIKDGTGAITAMAYDTKGNLTQLTDPVGNVTRYTFDAAGRISQEQDALGNATTFTYDANGKETSRTTQRTHNGAPVSMTMRRVLDANGQVLQETDANGATESSTYNNLDKLASRTDKLGNTTRYEYDSRVNLTNTLYADGTKETTGYDANGNEILRTDRAGRTTQFTYDALNRLIKTTLPDGSELNQTYDAAGQLIDEIDARGNKTTYQYDAAGRRTKLTNALGNVNLTAYDVVGNVTSITDARGNTTNYQYDAANRRTRTNFPDGTSASVVYDASGRKVSETDQTGNITLFAYDALGRLITVTDPLGGVTRYTYDEVGNKLSQEDALRRITRWEYDNLGRVTKRILPEGQFETFSYDANGNTLTHTDFKGATTQFTYDADNRVLRKRHANGSEVNYTYTPTGLPATVTDSRGVTQNAYDAQNRLTQVKNPDGSLLAYTYDAAGNRTQLTVQQGVRSPRVTRFGYDALNRLASVTDPESGVTTYTYDANGNRASATLPNGIRAVYTYDVLNRLTLLEHRRADNSLVARFAYTLSANGQRVRAAETVNGISRTVDYTYDAYQRLVREQIADPANGNRDATYVYDAVGNRLTMTVNNTSTTYTYDANDRLLSETTGGISVAYSYDANGNTLTKRQGATTLATYTWDAENRLTGAIQGGNTVVYAYDAAGNRVAKTLNGVTSHYLVDTNREYAEVVEERAANGDLIAGYVHGDDLLKQLRSGQGTYYHADGLGSTRALTNTAGTVTDTWHYEAFGTELVRTGSTVNEYRYTGEQIDANTGFYYLRARWMDPEVGRFVSLDQHPGCVSCPNTLHKYTYVAQDPVNRLDPSGEFFGVSTLVGFNISVGTRVAAIRGAFQLGARIGWQAIGQAGRLAERYVEQIVRQCLNPRNFTRNPRIPGSAKRLDGLVELADGFLNIEVKSSLPKIGSVALKRLKDQLLAAQSAGLNPVVVFGQHFTKAQMRPLLQYFGKQGVNTSSIKFIGGFVHFAAWIGETYGVICLGL